MKRKDRRRRMMFFLTITIIALGALFLPGPSGLISILLKLHHINREKRQILLLHKKSDTLQQKINLWQKPEYATKVARQLLGIQEDTATRDSGK